MSEILKLTNEHHKISEIISKMCQKQLDIVEEQQQIRKLIKNYSKTHQNQLNYSKNFRKASKCRKTFEKQANFKILSKIFKKFQRKLSKIKSKTAKIIV